MGPDEIEMKAAIADMPEIAHADLGMIAPDFCSHGLAKCGDVAQPERDVTADDMACRPQAFGNRVPQRPPTSPVIDRAICAGPVVPIPERGNCTAYHPFRAEQRT